MFSTEMALSQSTSFPTFQIPFRKHQFVGTSLNLRTLTETPRYPLISSFHTARSKPCSHLRTISCIAGEASSPSAPVSSVFVKGLADSVSEGRLRKVFSDFGEVSNVKIIINEKTQQSLGYGYVWFNSKEDAQLAVEAMNGKLDPGSQYPESGKNPKLLKAPTRTGRRVPHVLESGPVLILEQIT